MKKTRFFLVLAGIAALAIVLIAACSNSTGGLPDDPVDPLVYSDIVDGKVVEITISRPDPSRAVLTPRTGDSYEIKYDGVVVSKGTVTKVEGDGQATFTPAADSPGGTAPFTGTFAAGSLSLPSIPIAGGETLEGIDAAPVDEDTVTLDELLRKYMVPRPEIWPNWPNTDGRVDVYSLDPARFDEFKAALEAGGEYYRAPSWIEKSRDHELGLNYAEWAEKPEGGFSLRLRKEDNSSVGYEYEKDPKASGTTTDELLSKYMVPKLANWPSEGLVYEYYLNPARFEAFKSDLEATGEYYREPSWTGESEGNDRGLTYGEWVVKPDGGFNLFLRKNDNSIVGYEYTKNPQASVTTMDELLRKYMMPQPRISNEGISNYICYLDPARFDDFKAALDTAGEYEQDGDMWTGPIEDREAHHKDLAFAQWHEGTDGRCELTLDKKDNSRVKYSYKKVSQAPVTTMEGLLREYMAPEPMHSATGVEYHYFLDPARFGEFKAVLNAGGEYYQAPDLIEEHGDGDRNSNYARWAILPEGKFVLSLIKEDNSEIGYFYEKNPQASGTKLNELLRTYMGPEPQMWSDEGLAYVYHLDFARFDEFRTALEAGGEYYRAPDETGTQNWARGFDYARWSIQPDNRFRLDLGKSAGSIVMYLYEKDPQASGTKLDELLLEYMVPHPQIWHIDNEEGIEYVYYLDPDRFEAFKTELDAAGEYSQTGSWTEKRDYNLGLNYVRWSEKPKPAGDGFHLMYCKEDNSVDEYGYEESAR